MPTYNKYTSEDYSIIVWESTESIDYFEKEVFLTQEEKKYYSIIRNSSRRKEWLTVRYILQKELNIKNTIIYNKKGKPYISDNHISITHSNNFVAVMISKWNCAIDIEKISSRVSRVSHKAFSANEMQFATDDELLTVLWCAKETAFKLADTSNVDFIEDIQIFPFSPSQSGSLICEIRKPIPIKIKMYYETIKNCKFVWTFNNKT